jgi:hypothetical protein
MWTCTIAGVAKCVQVKPLALWLSRICVDQGRRKWLLNLMAKGGELRVTLIGSRVGV